MWSNIPFDNQFIELDTKDPRATETVAEAETNSGRGWTEIQVGYPR